MSKSAISDKPSDGKDKYGMTPGDWARLDAMTDDEINAAALTDPDNPPTTPEQLARWRRISPAKFIRQKLGLSLEGFAKAYGIPTETLRAWERHETEPSPAELAFLRAITRAPEAVRQALAPETEPAV